MFVKVNRVLFTISFCTKGTSYPPVFSLCASRLLYRKEPHPLVARPREAGPPHIARPERTSCHVSRCCSQSTCAQLIAQALFLFYFSTYMKHPKTPCLSQTHALHPDFKQPPPVVYHQPGSFYEITIYDTALSEMTQTIRQPVWGKQLCRVEAHA